MNTEHFVQQAMQCLNALDHARPKSLSVDQLSAEGNMSFDVCLALLGRLAKAGLVRWTTAEDLALTQPLQDLDAHDLLAAIWRSEEKPATFDMLVGAVTGYHANVTQAIVSQLSGLTDRWVDSSQS